MSHKNITFFTFTNDGYTHYTQNLLESINKNNIDINLKIYTLDENSFTFFKNKHENVVLFEKNNFSNSLLKQSDKEFGNLMTVKFEIIHQELLKENPIVYIDGDITIKKNISEYLYNFSKESDIIFQNDLRPSKPDLINVCAGFMYIKPNQKTRDFFKTDKKLQRKFNRYKTHDQTYINKNKNKFKYKMLPLEDFPNGAHYYKHNKDLDPYLIHFNYVIGEKKQELMVKYGEWYI